MQLLYKPFGFVVSVLGGLAASAVFRKIWTMLAHEEEAPQPKDFDRSWGEVATAALVQGAVFGTTKALIDRAGAKAYASATGTIPA